MSERIQPGNDPLNHSFEFRAQVTHQLPRVVASHLDVGAPLGRRKVTPRPVDLRTVP